MCSFARVLLLSSHLLAIGLTACSDAPPLDASPDDASGSQPGGDYEAPPPHQRPSQIDWPEPWLIIEGAVNPQLVQSPSGLVTLFFHRDAQVWAWRDPPTGPATAIAPGGQHETSIRAVAHPEKDLILVVTDHRDALLLEDGLLIDGPTPIYGGPNDLNMQDLAWLPTGPIATALGMPQQGAPGPQPYTRLAFEIPTSPLAPSPPPQEKHLFARRGSIWIHYHQLQTMLPLPNGDLLSLGAAQSANPSDPSYESYWLHWAIFTPDPTGPPFYQVGRTGYLETPYPFNFIQPWSTEDGRHLVAFSYQDTGLVGDIQLMALSLAEDGTPSLPSPPRNISQTPGATQHSDYPLFIPTGDGRYWLPWRETDTGPHIALLDEDLHIQRLSQRPPATPNADDAQPLSAIAPYPGALHLAAGLRTDDRRDIYLYTISLY